MRRSLLLLASLATLGAAPSDDTSPQPVSLAIAPGPAHDSALATLVKPYAEATATTLSSPAWDGSPDALRKLLAAHGADLLLLDGALLAQFCRTPLLEKLDWTALAAAGVPRDRFSAGASSDCGLGAYVSATVLAWDRQKIVGWPGWPDFWDVAKHPGRRALRRGARGNLEVALMADGVAMGDVYRTLRSADGVDRAFRKLDQLKPYVLWWDKPDQPAQLLATAKVLLTTAPADSLPDGPGSHTGVQWAGSLQEVTSWARPADASHKGGALAALVIALDPARDAIFSRATRLAPGTKAAAAMLPAGDQQGALAIDEGFWADNGDKLEARFAGWVGK